METEKIVKRIKLETNNSQDFIFRKKIVNKKKVLIIYNEPLVSGDKISDFIIRSLTSISDNNTKKVLSDIENNISNFKLKKIHTYKEIVSYLHRGFTIILVENEKEALALETKGELARSVTPPDTEPTVRGAKDAFVEEYQKNIGLIRKRIKTNDLWAEDFYVGKYTDTKVGLLYIKSIARKELVEKVKAKIKTINIDGVINSGMIKNLIEDEKKCSFPTIQTTERPDIVVNSLLRGKVVIIIDNTPYALIIPGILNDYFKTPEDFYSKASSTTFIRILKYVSFLISLTAPAIYISLITYNQEMLPTKLIISIAMQRAGVPFPAFLEALIMAIAFEILRESDLRAPGFTGSTLSTLGALILGQAAVSAGIVSPIMIIIVSITAISSLPFSEPELISGLRLWRIIFMLGASLLGIIGILGAFILFIAKLSNIEIFGIPYLVPFFPTYFSGLKNSIIKFPLRKLDKREKYLSNNIKRLGG